MKKTKLIAAATLFSSLSMAFGVTLQFDFGDNTRAGSSTFDGVNNATLSPAGITDASYNGGNADVAAGGLVFGDGTVATGVSLDLGLGADGSATFFDAASLRGSDSTGNGVLASALAQDWVFTTNGDNLGVRVSGLEAGVYDVFALVSEPNQLGRTYDVGIGVGDTSTIGDLALASISDASIDTSFLEGSNFVRQRVTVNSTSDFITVIVDPTAVGTNTEGRFGTLGALQIVSAVPEPSSVALLGLGFMGFALRRRR